MNLHSPRRLAAAAVLLAGCARAPAEKADSGDLPAPPGTFRVVFVSDTHVIGPEYVCCSESEGIDNDSIMKTPARLESVVARIRAIDPPPERVFILGDIVHDTMVLDAVEDYTTTETGFSRAAEILGTLPMPVHPVWGNHDYYLGCSPEPEDKSREFAHAVFAATLGAEPTGVVETGGWRFVVANSQLGPTWEPGHPLCDTGLASYGEAQLDWIDAELAKGDPTFVLAHYMMLVTQNNERPGHPKPGLRAVLEAHANLRLFLVGHTHRWIDLRTTETFPHMVLGATRYDDDNFIVVDFEIGGTDYTIADEEKLRWYTPCASTFTYDGGAPRPDGDPAAEDGDCTPP